MTSFFIFWKNFWLSWQWEARRRRRWSRRKPPARRGVGSWPTCSPQSYRSPEFQSIKWLLTLLSLHLFVDGPNDVEAVVVVSRSAHQVGPASLHWPLEDKEAAAALEDESVSPWHHPQHARVKPGRVVPEVNFDSERSPHESERSPHESERSPLRCLYSPDLNLLVSAVDFQRSIAMSPWYFWWFYIIWFKIWWI